MFTRFRISWINYLEKLATINIREFGYGSLTIEKFMNRGIENQ